MSSSPLVYSESGPTKSNRIALWSKAWLPVAAFSMVFVIESTAYFGSDRTSVPLQRVAEALFGYEIGVYWETIHHVLRKAGHAVGYGMFSLVCFRGFLIMMGAHSRRLGDRLRAHGLAILSAFLLGSADEIHQTFLPNRCGAFSDVLLDTSGAVALGLALFVAMTLANRGSRSNLVKAQALLSAPQRREEDSESESLETSSASLPVAVARSSSRR